MFTSRKIASGTGAIKKFKTTFYKKCIFSKKSGIAFASGISYFNGWRGTFILKEAPP